MTTTTKPLNLVRSGSGNVGREDDSPGIFPKRGEPPYDGGMEARLSEVEKAVAHIDATLPTLASKSDISASESALIKWIVGTAFAGMAAFITVMTFVLNNAVPKAPAATPAQQSPIIINVPSPAQAPPK